MNKYLITITLTILIANNSFADAHKSEFGGPEKAQELLSMGVNDLGGTLMNESISRAAGAKNGQEITAKEIVDIIRDVSLIPARRNTVYEIKEIFDKHNPIEIEPLIERGSFDPILFLKETS